MCAVEYPSFIKLKHHKPYPTMEQLFSWLHERQPVSPPFREQLTTILRTRTVNKRQFILKAGHVCRECCFVESGLFRVYYAAGDRETNSRFVKQGEVLVSVESFFRQLPADESIQALEDSVIYYSSQHELETTCASFPELNISARKLLQQHYHEAERLQRVRLMEAQQRYQWFVQAQPELVQRVPAKYIASYLGMTEVMISKVKKKFY
jgi:CRP-like cAMP-binding protein